MKLRLKLALLAVLALLLPSAAYSQCTPVSQNGPVQNSKPVTWLANCVLSQAGGSAGSPIVGGLPMITDFGVMGPLGILDANILGPYHQALFSWSGNNFNINLNSQGGAGTPAGFLIINGGTPIPLGGGVGGFPIVLGSTSINNNSTTTNISGLTLTNPKLAVPAGSCALGVGLDSSNNVITTACGGITWPALGMIVVSAGISGNPTGISSASLFGTPPPIGSGVPNTGLFTTLGVTGAISGSGVNALFAAPPTIGSVTPPNATVANLTITGTCVGCLSGPANLATFTPGIVPMGAGASPFAASEIADVGLSGVTIGNPAGGPKGSGSLNMSGCFINNVPCATTTGGGVTFPANGSVVVSNGTSAPAGLAPVNGNIIYGVSSAWAVTSLATILASPPAIGGTLAAAGSFTTLAASSTVSGIGFSTYLASPPAIGGTVPAAGAFTTLSASGAVSGAGITALFASPPAIGGTAPAGGAFTTLSASSTVSGAGITALFATPPAIGGTTPAAGAFTTLSVTSTVSGAGITALFASPPAIGGTVAAAGSFTTLAASSTVSGAGITSLFAAPPTIGGTTPPNATVNNLTVNGTCTGCAVGGSVGTSTSGFLAVYNTTTSVTGEATITAAQMLSLPTGDVYFGVSNLPVATSLASLHAAPGPIGSVTPSTGAFTTLSASSTVSGAGFSTYLASPPAIGGTVAAAGTFTNLTATGTVLASGLAPGSCSSGLALNASNDFITISCPGGSGISGMTATQYAVAGNATTITSSKTASGIFDDIGTTRGAIHERGASVWGIIPPSAVVGAPFTSGGTGADPSYYANAQFGAGQTIINYNAAALPTDVTSTLLLGMADGTNAHASLDSFSNFSIVSLRSFGGTGAAPTATPSSAQISAFRSTTYDGTATGGVGELRCYAAELQAAGHHGAYCNLWTTPVGSTTIGLAMQWEADGGITVPASVVGGDKGPGTINATAIYAGGVLLGGSGLQYGAAIQSVMGVAFLGGLGS